MLGYKFYVYYTINVHTVRTLLSLLLYDAGRFAHTLQGQIHVYIDGSVQDSSISSVLSMAILNLH